MSKDIFYKQIVVLLIGTASSFRFYLDCSIGVVKFNVIETARGHLYSYLFNIGIDAIVIGKSA